MSQADPILYEIIDSSISHITLNRPSERNAQNVALLRALNAALDRAMADGQVKVVLLDAAGPHFSAGHDLNEATIDNFHATEGHVGTWSRSDDAEGVERFYATEKELYQGFCDRWRSLSKPVVVAVQGFCIAGGLMLVWPFDFVIAADDAVFQDNTIDMGLPGVEYFGHVWELGIRKGKEFLMTGCRLSAAEAERAGMVNHVVPAEDLPRAALAFARTLASKPLFALQLGKQAINAAFESPSFAAMQSGAFNAHHLAHAHYRLKGTPGVDATFLESFKTRKQKPEN